MLWRKRTLSDGLKISAPRQSLIATEWELKQLQQANEQLQAGSSRLGQILNDIRCNLRIECNETIKDGLLQSYMDSPVSLTTAWQ